MNKSRIIPLAFLLGFFGTGISKAEEFRVSNNVNNASFLFRVFSDVGLNTGQGFSLQKEGKMPCTNYMREFLEAGDTMLFLLELPDGEYKVLPIGHISGNFEPKINPSSVNVGENFLIYEGKSICTKEIDLFLDYIARTFINFKFSCPREIALSAREIVLKTESGVERCVVQTRGKDYFQANIPYSEEKGFKSLEILVDNGHGLRRADVSIGDYNVFSDNGNPAAKVELSSKRDKMNVRVFLNDPNKGYEKVFTTRFIKNPGREIQSSEFDNFLFENPGSVPPGEYLVEVKRGNEIYRGKFVVPSAGKAPDYLKLGEGDIYESAGECNIVLQLSNRVYNEVYEKIRNQVATEIYSPPMLTVGSEKVSGEKSIIFRGQSYNFEYDFSRDNNNLKLRWNINGESRTVFDLSKDEILAMAKTQEVNDDMRKDYFHISRSSTIEPFRLSVEGYTYFDYVSHPSGRFLNRQLRNPFGKQTFGFTLRLQQAGSGADISSYFE
jgi:hypothetical protein